MEIFLFAASSLSCPSLTSEPHAQLEIVRPGRNDSDEFSIGTVVQMTCTEGYRLNVGNRTVRCNRGHWKPNRNQIETEKKKLGSREIVEHKIERGITRSLFRWKLWSVGRSVGWLVDFLWFCFGGLQERK